jgi:pimeloyl-ACP methyl ester carboxylesterase
MVARPTIVLLLGGPGADHSLLKPEFSAMADAAQVVYLDQRGSGRSDYGDPDLWTWDQWADDVAGFCRALHIAAPVLVGTSGGGRVAVACATPACQAGWSWTARCSARDPWRTAWRSSNGAAAREAAARYIAGDTSSEAAKAWAAQAMPLYGSASARRPGAAEPRCAGPLPPRRMRPTGGHGGRPRHGRLPGARPGRRGRPREPGRRHPARNLVGPAPGSRTSCLRRRWTRRLPAGTGTGIRPASCLPAGKSPRTRRLTSQSRLRIRSIELSQRKS